MDNQQYGAQGRSYGMPPLLAPNDTVFSEKRKRIVEDKGGRFEREAVVLPLVDPVLFIVPLKPHRYTKCITRRVWWTGATLLPDSGLVYN